jgi:hypothetical protein
MTVYFNKLNIIKFAIAICLVISGYRIVSFFNKSDQSEIQAISQSLIEKIYRNLTEALIPKKSAPATYKKIALNITSSRLNRFFDILHANEKLYPEVLDQLNVVSFQRLIDGKHDQNLVKFNNERNKFLRVEDGKFRVTEEFLSYLQDISERHSFQSPRNYVIKAKIEKVFVNFFFTLVVNSNLY